MNEEHQPNPFQSPVSSSQAEPTNQAGNHRETVQILKQTRPWTITIAVLCAICGGLMLIGGLFFIGSLYLGPSTPGTPMDGAPFMLLGLIYPLMSILYIVPAVWLFKYSGGINKYAHESNTTNLNTALRAQKSFWRFCGISVLVVIVLYFLAMIGITGFSAF